MTNIRRNRPSASGMYRHTNCHGSFGMEEAARKLQPVEDSSPDADSGNRVHAALSGDEETELHLREADTMAMCEEQTERLLESWKSEGEIKTFNEVRLGWISGAGVVEVTEEKCKRWDAMAEPPHFMITGQFDRLYIQGNRALLIDYKTLHGAHPSALINPQLAVLAILIRRRYCINELRACVVQPWKGKPTSCDYDTASLDAAEAWLLAELVEIDRALPEQRKAGPWCKFCRANADCETFSNYNLQTLEIIDPLRLPADPKEQRSFIYARTRSRELAPEVKIAIKKRIPLMKRFIEAFEDGFEDEVDAGHIPGWKIEVEAGKRKGANAQLALNALSPLGVTADDMIKFASVPLGPLEEIIRERSGIKSQTAKRTTYNLTGDEAKAKLSAALEAAGALERGKDRKTPVPTGGMIEE